MKKRLILMIGFISTVFVVFLSACTVEKAAPTATVATQESPKVIKVSDEEIKHFNEYVPKIRGGSFLKSATIEGNKALVEYASYKEYTAIKKDKPVDEKTYNDYWLTGDAIRKALSEESVRLLREIPTLSEIKIVMAPFDGKKQTVTLDRKAAESFYNVNLKELYDDKELKLWKDKVATQFTKETRDKFEKQFIKTE